VAAGSCFRPNYILIMACNSRYHHSNRIYYIHTEGWTWWKRTNKSGKGTAMEYTVSKCILCCCAYLMDLDVHLLQTQICHKTNHTEGLTLHSQKLFFFAFY